MGSATTELIVQGDARVTGILSVGTGTLVITDTGINATGIITAAGFKIGTGVTVSEVGNFDITGIVTATKFVGDGSGLTNLSGGGEQVLKVLKVLRKHGIKWINWCNRCSECTGCGCSCF